MGGNGRGGNNRGGRRRFSKQSAERAPRRERESAQSSRQEPAQDAWKGADLGLSEGKLERARGSLYERPRWKAPVLSSAPIPVPDCPWCGKPIKDISAAIADKTSGEPVHFDCVLARIGEGEILETGDAVSYIGGGRFGVIHFNNLPDTRDFNIKKIFEWENKEDRSEWRQSLSDHFSVT
jgi:hypothetical protein